MDFLHFGPADFQPARLENDSLDARIRGRFPEGVPNLLHGQRSLVLEHGQRNFRLGFLGDFAFELKNQRRSVRNRDRPLAERSDQFHHGKNQNQRGKPANSNTHH